jgi:hypothetical protein
MDGPGRAARRGWLRLGCVGFMYGLTLGARAASRGSPAEAGGAAASQWLSNAALIYSPSRRTHGDVGCAAWTSRLSVVHNSAPRLAATAT